MDKKLMTYAAGLMCLSWAAIIPVYLLLKKNRELKNEDERRRNRDALLGRLPETDSETSRHKHKWQVRDFIHDTEEYN